MIELPPINLLAAVVAAGAAFLIGGVNWAIFTPSWSRRHGRPAEDARPTPTNLVIVFLTRVVVALILAVFVGWAAAQGAVGGAEIGILAWLGFVVPPGIGQALFERKPWQVVAIGLPESLLGFLVMGAIVGVWT